jgi:hypothetical protein
MSSTVRADEVAPTGQDRVLFRSCRSTPAPIRGSDEMGYVSRSEELTANN